MEKTKIVTEEISKELVEKYMKAFDEEFSYQEECLKYLFKNAKNDNEFDIAARVVMLDTFYSTQIHRFNPIDGIQNLVERIKNIKDLDKRLSSEETDFELYDEIAISKSGDRNAWSFASKFLSFSNPNNYPIMDSYNREMLWEFHANGCDFEYDECSYTDYATFCRNMKSFKEFVNERLGTSYSLKEIDMFLWQYGKSKLK